MHFAQTSNCNLLIFTHFLKLASYARYLVKLALREHSFLSFGSIQSMGPKISKLCKSKQLKKLGILKFKLVMFKAILNWNSATFQLAEVKE